MRQRDFWEPQGAETKPVAGRDIFLLSITFNSLLVSRRNLKSKTSPQQDPNWESQDIPPFAWTSNSKRDTSRLSNC